MTNVLLYVYVHIREVGGSANCKCTRNVHMKLYIFDHLQLEHFSKIGNVHDLCMFTYGGRGVRRFANVQGMGTSNHRFFTIYN